MTAGQPKMILIVEDDELQRMHLVSIVEDAGYVALEAGDADHAGLNGRCDARSRGEGSLASDQDHRVVGKGAPGKSAIASRQPFLQQAVRGREACCGIGLDDCGVTGNLEARPGIEPG